MTECMILGGAEEIGANSCYLEIDGTGILIDAGLHPRVRDERSFPQIEALGDRPTDAVFVTHAHTDHLGGIPYLLRKMPHLQTIMTRATRDLSYVMMNNNAKLLQSDVNKHFPAEALEFYNRNEIALLRQAFEAADYGEPITLRGFTGRSDVNVTFHWSGHILGSAGLVIENQGTRIVHTGDVMFQDQQFIRGAALPRKHADVVITEATNCAEEDAIDLREQRVRLADFINRITDKNGSVLIPSFALGKTQEMLSTLYSLMRKGSIPNLPIYSGGMAIGVNKIYDHFCYQEPVKVPGFEISDIPQRKLTYGSLMKGDYFKEPSIVVASSGMMTKDTTSYRLAQQWMKRPNFGIAFVGYQDPSSPGYQLLNSKKNEPFDLAGREVTRTCEIERLRFSAHASKDDIVGFIGDVRPHTVVITHGDPEACDALALALHTRFPGMRIIIPQIGKPYLLDQYHDARDTASMLDQERNDGGSL